MASISHALFRTTRLIATGVAGAAMLTACSNAGATPASPTTAPSVAAVAVATANARATQPSSSTPSPTAQPAAWAAVSPGPVAPGTYAITDPPNTGVSQLTFTLPA